MVEVILLKGICKKRKRSNGVFDPVVWMNTDKPSVG